MDETKVSFLSGRTVFLHNSLTFEGLLAPTKLLTAAPGHPAGPFRFFTVTQEEARPSQAALLEPLMLDINIHGLSVFPRATVLSIATVQVNEVTPPPKN